MVRVGWVVLVVIGDGAVEPMLMPAKSVQQRISDTVTCISPSEADDSSSRPSIYIFSCYTRATRSAFQPESFSYTPLTAQWCWNAAVPGYLFTAAVQAVPFPQVLSKLVYSPRILTCCTRYAGMQAASHEKDKQTDAGAS